MSLSPVPDSCRIDCRADFSFLGAISETLIPLSRAVSGAEGRVATITGMRDRCYGTFRTLNIISALAMCAAVAGKTAKTSIGRIFEVAPAQAVSHTSACVGIKSTAQALMGFRHTRLISRHAGKEGEGGAGETGQRRRYDRNGQDVEGLIVHLTDVVCVP